MTTAERLRSYWGERQFEREALTALLARYWQVIAIVAIVGLAAGLRLWDLGERAIHHDESIHVKFAYDIAKGGVDSYVHDPVYHGPFQYFGTALIFKLPFFGDSDYTSRLLPALFGIALVGLPFLLRRQLGTTGVFIAAGLLALSPTLLYFSRFARNDIYVAFFTLAIAVCIWRYVAERRDGWLIAIAPLLALSFAAKEVTFITVAILIVFLNYMVAADLVQQLRASRRVSPAFTIVAYAVLLPTAWLVVALWPLLEEPRKRVSFTEMPAAGPLLIIVATLASPQYAPGVQKLWFVGDEGYQVAEEQNLMRVSVLTLLFGSAYVGLLWNWRVWLIAAALFYVPYVFLFTSFFTHPAGFWTGIWGSMDYWLGQQLVRRGNQPDYYYFMLTPVYEFLPLVFAIGGTFYYAFRAKLEQILLSAAALALVLVFSLMPESAPLFGEYHIQAAFVVAIAAVLFLSMDLFTKFLLFWLLSIFFSLTVAGEKMPWLSVHIALPLALLGAKVVSDILSATVTRKEAVTPAGSRAERRREIRERDEAEATEPAGLKLEPLFALGGGALLGLIAGAIFQAAGPASAASVPAWLLSVGALGLVVWAGASYSWRLAGQAAAVALMGTLLAFTLRAGGNAAFDQGDVTFAQGDAALSQAEAGGTPKELLIYAQGSPDLNVIRDKIEEMADRTGAGRDLPVVIDNSTDVNIWPWPWYLREFEGRGASYQSIETGFEPQPNSVVLVALKNDAQMEPYAHLAEERIEYTHMWWFPEFYRGLRVDDFLARVFQGHYTDTWRNYFIDRTVVGATASPDRVAYFFGAFDQGELPEIERPAPPGEIPQENRTVIGGPGPEEGQFSQPADVAVDGDGNLYVVDTLNHRIQIFAPDGSVTSFGEEGSEPGQFRNPQAEDDAQPNDGPWGIGVDDDGNIYVADTWNHRIQKFDDNGSFTLEFGAAEAEGQAGLFGPRDVAIDAEGNVLVADTGNKRIVKYNPDGELLQAYGGPGTGPGQFDEPTSISVAPDGDIYVADFWNKRIQHFDPQFTYVGEIEVTTWPRPEQTGITDRAYVVALPNGTVLATDPINQQILVFDPSGARVASWTLPEVGTFPRPTGITVGALGQVYLSDSSTSRVIRVPLTALLPAEAP